MSELERQQARIGIRELRQNLSVYVERVKAGETLEVTEHGRPVARLTPLAAAASTGYDRMMAAGEIIKARGDLTDLGPPLAKPPGRPSLSDTIVQMREEDPR